MKKKEGSGRIWRLLKVVYFFISVPLILILSGMIFYSERIYKGNGYFLNNYYLGILYILIVLIGYIILTDILRRVISYINNGDFQGFIMYGFILKKYLFYLIVIGGITISILLGGSQRLINECTGGNESFDDSGICSCDAGFIKQGGKCVVLECNGEGKMKLDSGYCGCKDGFIEGKNGKCEILPEFKYTTE